MVITLLKVSVFACIFIVTWFSVDFYILGNWLTGINGWKLFFNTKVQRSFEFEKSYMDLSKIPKLEDRVNIYNKCLTLSYGYKNEFKKEWCFSKNQETGRSTIKPKKGNGKKIIIFGGSYAFGDGLDDDETIASQFAELGYTALNFGVSGGGAHHFLRDLYSNSLKVQGEDKDVIIIYPYIEEHLFRQRYGRSSCCFAWGGRFELGLDRELKYVDNFENTYLSDLPIFLMTVTNSGWIINDFLSLHKKIQAEDFELNCHLVEEAKKKIDSLTNVKSRLIVIDMWSRANGEHQKCIEKFGGEYLTVGLMISKYDPNFSMNEYFFEIDSHPTSKTAKVIAKYIDENL